MSRGRSTEYTKEVADIICQRVALGESLRSVCEDDALPARSTVFKWLNEQQYFSDQYALAKSVSADSDADRIENIAERTLNGEVNPHAARVAIDAYKWTASKKEPKKYGDKLGFHGGSGPESPVSVEVKQEQKDNLVSSILGIIKPKADPKGDA